MSNIIEKIKDIFHAFDCQGCGKRCNDREEAKFNIYVEKWFDKDTKSAIEVKLCPRCAEPIVDIIKKAKAFASLKKKNIELDPHAAKKPYEFED